MNKIVSGMLLASLLFCGKAFALGLDVGPVHTHTKGSTEELKLVIDSITKDEDTKAVTKLIGHRKGSDDTFKIKVVPADLDETTLKLIKTKLKEDAVFKAVLEKLEENWKLLKLREIEED